MALARLAVRQLAVLVAIGVALAAVAALFLPHHGYVHDFRDAAIVVGAAALALALGATTLRRRTP